MASRKDPAKLTRRERQIMDVIYELERASVAEVRERLPDPPGYSAVRALLAKLETKGHVRHRQDGPRYVYLAVMPRAAARERAVNHLVRVFFDNSPAKAVNALLSRSDSLSEEEIAELSQAIEKARKRGQ